ncbi:MAG: hypothetical protein IJU79_06910 [Desulfovibrionaceae bacterium]|nr:hypothetical protein [Desulfovibrionaceae bacterium]
MISKGPLFSGFLTTILSVVVWAAVVTGGLQLPLGHWAPKDFFSIPLVILHSYAITWLLFLVSYILTIWLCKGRMQYHLTWWGWLTSIIYAGIVLSGLLLLLDSLNIWPLYGNCASYVKISHAAFGLIVILVQLLSPSLASIKSR